MVVLELCNHISTLFNKGEFKDIMLQPITTDTIETNQSFETSRPLGIFGDMTLNEIATNL